MPNKLDLVDIKDAIDKLQNDDSYNEIGKLNLAAWLGERTHFLVAKIEKLHQERSDLLAALEVLIADIDDCETEEDFIILSTGCAIEQARAALAGLKGAE